MKVGRRRVRIPRRLFELLDVRACDEGSTCAHDDDGPGRRITAHPLDRRLERVTHLAAQRVYGRVVDLNDGDAVMWGDEDSIQHGSAAQITSRRVCSARRRA